MALTLEQDEININKELEILALEAGVIDNLVDRLGKVLPKITSTIIDFSKQLTTDVDKRKYKELKSLYILTNKIPQDKTLENVALKLVKIPPNFSGNMLEFINYLNSTNDDIYKYLNSYFVEFNTLLNKVINNQSEREALTSDDLKLKTVKSIVKKYVDELDTFRDPKVKSDKYPLAKVINSVNEVKQLAKKSVELTENLMKHDVESIKDNINKTVELLNIINNAIKRKEYGKVSSAIAMDLSEGSYVLGELIELYSLLRYIDDQALESVIEITNIVLKSK